MRRSSGSLAVSASRPVSRPVAGSRSNRPPGGIGRRLGDAGQRRAPAGSRRRCARRGAPRTRGGPGRRRRGRRRLRGRPSAVFVSSYLKPRTQSPGLVLRRALAQRGHDRLDRSQVAVHLLQVQVARRRDVGVPVDEAGHHRAAARGRPSSFGPRARFRTSASLPTARKRPPAMATARARGWASSTVTMLPFQRTSSASVRRVGSRAKDAACARIL